MYSKYFMAALLVINLLISIRAQSYPNDLETSGDCPLLSGSFERFSADIVRAQVQKLVFELSKQPNSRGVVVVYGNYFEMGTRLRIVTDDLKLVNIDPSRIEYRHGGSISDPRTDFWILPAGVRLVVQPEAYISIQFAKVSDGAAIKNIKDFFRFADRESGLYIVNYGTSSEIQRREDLLRNSMGRPGFHDQRVTIVRGGKKRIPTTVMWIVPPGAANPPV